MSKNYKTTNQCNSNNFLYSNVEMSWLREVHQKLENSEPKTPRRPTGETEAKPLKGNRIWRNQSQMIEQQL